jgi:hypothetical protein
MNREDRMSDERLSRLLAAAHAAAEPALMTRVRARLEAPERESGALAWLARPAALAASLALLLVAAGLGVVLVDDLHTADQYQVTSLTEQLLTENAGSTAAESADGTTTAPTTSDTGAAQ